MKGEYPNPTMSHCPRLWQNPFYVKHWIDFWDNVVFGIMFKGVLLVLMYHHGEKMSGLKQKAKKRLGEMERTCGLTITDSLGVDITDGVIEIILGDAEEEISYYKKMANKYTKETYLLKEEIEKLKEDNTKIHFLYEQAQAENNKLVDCCERLGQIREHTKNFEHDFSEFAKWFAKKYGKYASADEIIIHIGLLKVKLDELVGLLGQNSGKPQPKKEEKEVNE